MPTTRACGGRVSTFGPVEEGEKRRPCRASAHAACPSPCSGDDNGGRGAAAADAPDRGCRPMATKSIPEADWSWTTPAAHQRLQGLSRWRQQIKDVVDAIGVGGATGRHWRRRPLPPNRDRADGIGPAGTHAYETAFWGGRCLVTSAPPREGAGRLAAMRACGGRAATVGLVEEEKGDARTGRRGTRPVSPRVVGTTTGAEAQRQVTPLTGVAARWQRRASPRPIGRGRRRRRIGGVKD